MIDYSDRGVCGLIFSWTGSTLSRTWPECILSMIFTAIFVAVIDLMDGWTVMDWYSKMGHDLLILPLAFLLVYRTGMAYNRFFEGRGHVGKMVLSARELARGITTYVKGDDPITKQNQANVARLVRAYTIALRLSLRKMESNPESVKELEAVLTKAEMAKITAVKKNFVLVIVKWIGDEVMKFKGQLLFDRATDFMEKKCQRPYAGLDGYAQACDYTDALPLRANAVFPPVRLDVHHRDGYVDESRDPVQGHSGCWPSWLRSLRYQCHRTGARGPIW